MALKPTSYEINPSLFLVTLPLSLAAAAPPAPEPTHHVVCVDVSGSMYTELPLIREQLKAKLPALISPGDAISIIWFSGRGQCGVLLEAVEPTLMDLAQIRKAIDHWLRPIALTGFKEPIDQAGEVIARLNRKAGARRSSLFFMSDGHDNQWTRPEILRAIDNLAPFLASSTFVEYGYYADHALLVKMAERTGGAVILAADFGAYEPAFETAMRRKGGASKRMTVTLGADPAGGVVFAIDDGLVLPYGVDGSTVTVPNHLTTLYYLSEGPVGKSGGSLTGQAFAASKGLTVDTSVLAGAYAALHVFAQRIQPKILWPILRALGDVRLIEEFSGCFGKQRYAAFVETTGKAAADGLGMFTKGYDAKRAPKEDAFTILDLFDLLASDKRCRVLTEDAGFTYSRIGRKAVGKDRMLTVTEGTEVTKLAEDLKDLGERREIAPIREWLAKLGEMVNGRKAALKFSLDKTAAELGYSIDGLVWNTDQPNLSFRVRKPGTVDIGASDAPAEVKAVLPATLATHQYRAYTVVKDGLVHIDALPVHLPQAVADVLTAVGVLEAREMLPEGDGVIAVIDIKKIPVINQKMITECRARDLAQMEWDLLTAKAEVKVLDHYLPEKENAVFTEQYGAPAAAWLTEHKVTAKNGYAPENTKANPTDVAYVTALKTKFPGLSSLPKVDDVRARMAEVKAAKEAGAKDPKAKKGKEKVMTPSMALMTPFLEEVDAFLASTSFVNAKDPQAAFETWLVKKAKDATTKKRDVERRVARVKACMIMSASWFADLPTFDDREVTLDLGGESRTVTFDLDDKVEVKL